MKIKTTTPTLILLALGYLALPLAKAVVPAPDGGYPRRQHGRRAECSF